MARKNWRVLVNIIMAIKMHNMMDKVFKFN
jgi:hypothetical protein